MKFFGSIIMIALFIAACQGQDTAKNDKDTGLYNKDYTYGYYNRPGQLGYSGYNRYGYNGYGGYGTNGYGSNGYGANGYYGNTGYGRPGYYY